MKKLTSLIITSMLIFSLTACKGGAPDITEAEAKKAILNHTPDAIITECIYKSASSSYEIEYKTAHNVYIAIVDADSGEISSVTIKEEITTEDPSVFETPEEDTDDKILPADTALSIAFADSGISGTASLVKNDLNRESKTYTVVFRSGNREFTYIIDAVTGAIISSETEMDS